VTDSSHGMRLMRRVIQEHRRKVILLTAAFALNLLAYIFIVRPLAQRVANVEQNTLAAEQSLAAARADYARANGTFTGKERAAKELATFYSSVLAQDLSGARRLTYGRLSRLARMSRLEYQRGRYEPVEERDGTVSRFKANVELTGTYNDVRNFIHAIETAPEFVVIDNISLAEGGSDNALNLSLELSTYFRSAGR
jgi:Tfp pilus assembly protein PilO